MKCEEAAEFVSALCDGERIPPTAAEHVGACDTCRARLKEYLEMGAELRRVASLELTEEPRARGWMKTRRVTPSWWLRGWETMRIPRFAFALLLVVIVALGSSLVIVRARAYTQGAVLMLTTRAATGETFRCALSMEDKNREPYAWTSPGRYLYGVRVVSNKGDQIELGVRVKFIAAAVGPGTYTASYQDLYKIPEKQYWFRPGEKLEVDVPEWGTMVLTGELMDHMPSLVTAENDVQMDPKPGELRVISPLLLRGNKVMYDFEGGTAIGTEKDRGVRMYIPSEGLWVVSLLPLKGAVEGRINLNRVSFELNGQSYTFVMGAPVARNEHIWILHDANYKPSDENAGHGFIGGADLTHLLTKSPAKD